MKKILMLLCLIIPAIAQAQDTFAPVGAEWWYIGDNGRSIHAQAFTNETWSDHIKVIGDTLVQGIACRKLEVTRMTKTEQSPAEASIDTQRIYFVHDNTDTTFFFNEGFNKFTPLYIFNAVEHDTICIPIPNVQDYDGFSDIGDSTFCFVIDTIITEEYDTAHLRSFYTRAITPKNYSWGNFDYGVDGEGVGIGKYTEKIGGNWHSDAVGLFPHFLSIESEEIGFPSGELRCYSDSNTIIKMSNLPCDSIPEPRPLSITNVEQSGHGIKVYPNPVNNGQFSLSLEQPFDKSTAITLTDLSGRLLYTTNLPVRQRQLQVQLPAVQSGVYFLVLHTTQGKYYHKIAVQR